LQIASIRDGTPKHDQIYTPISNRNGLAITTGVDSRLAEEKQPDWTKNAEVIIARALADEVKHAKLFDRVKIHEERISSLNLSKSGSGSQTRADVSVAETP
jgi:hypothetical protein